MSGADGCSGLNISVFDIEYLILLLHKRHLDVQQTSSSAHALDIYTIQAC